MSRKLPWLGPRWVSTSLPAESERMQTSMDAMAGGADIAQLPSLYRDIYSVKKDIIERTRDLTELDLDKDALIVLQNKYAGQSLGFLPLTARKKDLTVVLNRNTGDIIEIINVDPW